VQGVGKKWLFSATSSGFGYGYATVRIGVKVIVHCILVHLLK
jgi:hypothetical protein